MNQYKNEVAIKGNMCFGGSCPLLEAPTITDFRRESYLSSENSKLYQVQIIFIINKLNNDYVTEKKNYK